MTRKWLVLACVFLSGCIADGKLPFDAPAEGVSGNGEQTGGGVIERRQTQDGVELVLQPVDVWDTQKTVEHMTVFIDGAPFKARQRASGFLEKPYVRAGLFWSSRAEKVFLPVMVTGPKVDIRSVEIRAGGDFARLRLARNFTFTPAISPEELKKVSFAAFEMNPGTLRAIANADTARMTINTNRGALHMGLDVVGKRSEEDVSRNARVLFARFAGQMAAQMATETEI